MAEPKTLGPPYHHEDERECFWLRDGSGWEVWRRETGIAGTPGEMCDRDNHPCIDKACAAMNTEGCRYPSWRLCGHPAGRPEQTATPTPAADESGAGA